MRLIGSALGAIAVLAFMVGFAGTGGTAEAAKFTLRGVATGAEENPPVVGGPSVYVTVSFDDVAMELTYAATVSGVSADQVTAAHFHRGAKGVNGPVVYSLATTGFTQISGVVKVNAADVADIRAGNFYFNAHSKDNPGGFARMQLVWTPAAPAAVIAGQIPGRPGGPTMVQGRGGPSTNQGRPGGPAPTGRPGVRPPSTGDAGLATTTSLLPLVGLAAFALSGAGVFALSRRRY